MYWYPAGSYLFVFFLNSHLICLLILERKEGRERNIYQLLPICSSTGVWTLNLRMCPELESNPQPFGVWDDVPITCATGPGHHGATLRAEWMSLHWRTRCSGRRMVDKDEEVVLIKFWKYVKFVLTCTTNRHFLFWFITKACHPNK